MNIISDVSKDVSHKPTRPGGYEWWYFDAMSENGYSIVVIFYEGNPFSRKYIQAVQKDEAISGHHFPAISISLYKNGKPIFYSFEEVNLHQAFFSETVPMAKVGNNRFEQMGSDTAQQKLTYQLNLDQKLPNGDRLTGELQFFSSLNAGLNGFEGEQTGTDSHLWNLVQPRCEVTGRLQIEGYAEETIDFKGVGYHDHNTGLEPMKEQFDEWYWGRFHFENFTVIFYLMQENGVWDKRVWLIPDRDFTDLRDVRDLAVLSDFSLNLFGLNCARKISVQGEGIELLVQKERVTDSGPFYKRFEGMMVLKMDGQIYRSKGISEYIKPDRIYNRIFWPLVNMRIKYPGEAHWVQKSPILYRWTW